MVNQTIFEHWIFTDYLLPWVLVFVLIFALLEKSNILGEGKKQVNAIVGAVCAFALLAFPFSRDVIIGLIPFLVIAAMIIFIFLLLYGFVSGDKKGDPIGKGVKITIGVGVAIALVVAVLVVTGTWGDVADFFTSSNMGANVIFVIIAVAAVIAVLMGGGKSGGGGSKSDDE